MGNKINILEGFWRLSNSSEEIYACEKSPSNCAGNDTCKEGHVGKQIMIKNNKFRERNRKNFCFYSEPKGLYCEECDLFAEIWGER